jgi:hypothetical protein
VQQAVEEHREPIEEEKKEAFQLEQPVERKQSSSSEEELRLPLPFPNNIQEVTYR